MVAVAPAAGENLRALAGAVCRAAAQAAEAGSAREIQLAYTPKSGGAPAPLQVRVRPCALQAETILQVFVQE